MEPVVFNPSNKEDKEEPKNESTPVAINVTDGNQQDNPVTSSASSNAEEEPVTAPALAENTEVNEVPVSDHHKEVLPSLAIPAETIGTKKSHKKKLYAGLVAVVVIAAAAFGAFQIFGKSDQQKIVADPTSKDYANFRIGSDVPPFNAFYPSGSFTTGASYAVNFQIYEGLVGFENGDTIVPLLAESWTNPDDTTWVFKLKKGVKFHDGKELKAADVKRSIEVAQASEIPALIHNTIASATADSDHQVTIKTVSPDPILLNKLAFLMIIGETKVSDVFVGTGAYKVSAESALTEVSVILDAFDDHHLGRPSVRKISYVGYESTDAMMEALQKKEIDLSEYLIDISKKVAEVDGYRLIEQSTPDVNVLFMNTKAKNTPLAKKDVRQAIALAVDHKKILEAKGGAGRQLSQFTIPANFGYNPEIQPITRDIAKAKELLKKAGYPNGLTLTMQYRDAEPKVFEAYKAALAEAGITLKADPAADVDEFFGKVDGGTGQLFQYNVTSALVDSYDIFSFNFQSINYQNDELDSLLEKSNATLNVTERKQLLQQASKFLVDDFAAVPLYNPDGYYYISDAINFQQGDIAGLVNPGYIRKLSAK